MSMSLTMSTVTGCLAGITTPVMADNVDITDVLERVDDAKAATLKGSNYEDAKWCYPDDKRVIYSDEELDKVIDALIAELTQDEKFTFLGGDGSNSGPEAAGFAGQLKGIVTLGIPELEMHDGPAGTYYIEDTTNTPNHQMLAATWDKKSAYDFGKISGSEDEAMGANGQLGSQFDITRNPHFNRAKDQMGTDSFLASQLSEQETRGIEENNTTAVGKHFVGYAGSHGMPFDMSDVIISEQALHETYLTPFETAVKAGMGGIMNSYDTVNNKYTSSNPYIDMTVLRDMWNYKGFVISDWGGNHEFSLGLGTDIEMPSTTENSQANAEKKLASGEITQDTIDNSVRHVLWALGTTGYLGLVRVGEDGKAIRYKNSKNLRYIRLNEDRKELNEVRKENSKLARTIAEKGGVLLKNDDNALPLSDSDKVAVIGYAGLHHISGIEGERSYGTVAEMVSPYDALVDNEYGGLSKENVKAYVNVDKIGVTVPKANLYKTEAAAKNAASGNSVAESDHGVLRYYGTGSSEAGSTFTQGQMWGGNSTSNYWMVDKNGKVHDRDEVAAEDDVIDFNTGNKVGEGDPKGTFWFNNSSKGGNAFSRMGGKVSTSSNGTDGLDYGQAYTWKTYLVAPEDGEYTFAFSGIGGSLSGSIKGQGVNGSGSPGNPREGAQWFSNGDTIDETGKDIANTTVRLNKNEVYTIEFSGSADRDDKDLQLRLSWITPSQKQKNHDEAINAAKNADKTVVFIKHEASGSSTDLKKTRDALEIDADQLQLIKDLRTANKNGKLIVVLNNTTAVTMKDWINDTDAILDMYYSGQEGGIATAELLTGKVNPSGKLAYAIQADSADTMLTQNVDALGREVGWVDGVYTEPTVATTETNSGGGFSMPGPGQVMKSSHYMSYYDEGILTDYRWFDENNIDPQFDFGYGLSYTTFKYSDMKVEPKWKNGETAGYDVTFTVTNTGDVAGSDVAQIYLGKPEIEDIPVKGNIEVEYWTKDANGKAETKKGTVEEALGIDKIQFAKYQLAGFERVENLAPGESKTVTIHVNERSLSYWNTDGKLVKRSDGTQDKWTVAEGKREIYLAHAADDFVDHKTINVGTDVPTAENPEENGKVETPEEKAAREEAEAIEMAEAGTPAGEVVVKADDLGVTGLDGLTVTYQSKIPFFGKGMGKDLEKIIGNVTISYNGSTFAPEKAKIVKHPGAGENEDNASLVITKLSVKDGSADKKEAKKVQKAIKKATKASKKKPGTMKIRMIAMDLNAALSANNISAPKLSGKKDKLKLEFTLASTGKKFKTKNGKKDTFGKPVTIEYDEAKGMTVSGSYDIKGTVSADKIEANIK